MTGQKIPWHTIRIQYDQLGDAAQVPPPKFPCFAKPSQSYACPCPLHLALSLKARRASQCSIDFWRGIDLRNNQAGHQIHQIRSSFDKTSNWGIGAWQCLTLAAVVAFCFLPWMVLENAWKCMQLLIDPRIQRMILDVCKKEVVPATSSRILSTGADRGPLGEFWRQPIVFQSEQSQSKAQHKQYTMVQAWPSIEHNPKLCCDRIVP